MKPIKKAVVAALKQAYPDLPVYGVDTKEGYKRPSFFVYVTQTFAAPTKNYLHVSADIEIDYIQKKPDESEAIAFFEDMQELFCMKLPVGEALLNTSDLYMDFDNQNVPVFGFEVEYWEEVKRKPETAVLMRELRLSQKVEKESEEMGLPAMNVIFKAAAVNAIRRSDRGIVGMILREETVLENNPLIIRKVSEIPKEFSTQNQDQIRLALTGYVNAPSKIVVYVLGADEEGYTEALDYFSLNKATWLCCPSITTDKQEQAVTEWLKEQREARNRVKAVLPDTAGNHEGIVNYATPSASIGDTAYTAEQFCSRIAGLLAGTPVKQGATFAILEDVTDCTRLSRDAAGAEIDAGKFILYHDGEKVKAARGVNSLTTITQGKSAAWKKIKVVETMDMIHDDLILLVEDNYIGKYPNTYNNKCLLLSAVKSYFSELAHSGLIEDFLVDFDTEAIRAYLVEHKGILYDDAESMSDAEVKKQYTDEKIFLAATMNIVDVMEDITISITV